MARKKITANLNGGDLVTAMGDLLFQVHDASDDSIIATANYAAIGSVNTNGSDGTNINYTLDINYNPGSGLLGQIILDGVDVGDAEDIKIRCKDESGNESILSSSHAINILFQETFEGAQDPFSDVNWTVTNDEPSIVGFKKDSNLLIEALDDAVNSTTGLNNILTVDTWDIGTSGSPNVRTIIWDFTSDRQFAGDQYVGLIKQNPKVSINSSFYIKTESATDMKSVFYNSAGTPIVQAVTLDVATLKSFKIVINRLAYGTVDFYYWSGSAWTLINSETHTETGLFYIVVNGRVYPTSGIGSLTTIGNIFLLNEDIATQNPT